MKSFRLTTPRRHRDHIPPAVGVPDYVVDVSRPVQPWHWSSALLVPVELLAVTWSIPVIILVVGIPIALAAALVHWGGRALLSFF